LEGVRKRVEIKDNIDAIVSIDELVDLMVSMG
jgi:hypothetical protein